MPEVWRVRYTLNSTLLQDVTFPSKNEAMNYITENFPAHVRAPNAQYERACFVQATATDCGSDGRRGAS